jgi:fibronectin-binding autotransporter adhesin
MPALAQVPAPVTLSAGTLVNTTMAPIDLGGTTQSGSNGPGYFVTSTGNLTISNGTLTNYTTTGGEGSGGGLGAGGAIFIDTGGKVTLNGVNFVNNSVVGGLGGTSSPYGGNLNNIQVVIAPDNSPNGANGSDGKVHYDDQYLFGDGNGNGTNSDNFQAGANNGGNATNGVGGIGGNGGPGTNGWATNPVAQQNVTIANTTVTTDAIGTALDSATELVEVAALAGEIAAGADPFETPISEIEAAKTAAEIIINAAGIANDVIGLENDIQNQVLAQATLDSWQKLYANGEAGNGGNGGTGGNGGAGSDGFGGGAGGMGGVYGLAANPAGEDGTGGNGGAGGNGGFGGGGGAGGYAFGSSDTLCGAAGCSSSDGTPGAGGTAGFGGGVGSTGGVTNETQQCNVAIPGIACGGGGGDGYGGAIFVNSNAELDITGTSTFFGNSAQGGSSLNGGAPGSAAGSDLFIMHGAYVNIAPGVDSTTGASNVVTFYGTIADDSNATLNPLGLSSYAYDSAKDNPAASYGAALTIYAGETNFYGLDTYSGNTVINGGTFGNLTDPALLNTASKTGTPDYSKTDGMLQADNGIGLPTSSNLDFSGPNQFTGGVLQLYCGENPPCTSLTFTRALNPNPTFTNPGGVQWTGSGGFAAIDAPLTVTLNNDAQLTWGLQNSGFIQQGYSLIFGSATSDSTVTFTNAINLGTGTIGAGTAASILVADNGTSTAGSTAIMSGILSGGGDLSINGGGYNGTLELTAANTYSGATAINSGELVLGPNGSIADSSNVTDNGILDISLTSGASIETLSGSGGVFLGSQTLTVTNASSTFSGTIADNLIGSISAANPTATGGNLTISSGTLTLTGGNTYTGVTTINTGAMLALSGLGSIADSSQVVDNGTFDISQTAIGAMITTLSGTGTANVGSKFLIFTNASTPFAGALNGDGSGGVIVAGGTLTLNGTISNIGNIMLDPGTAFHASATANAGLYNATSDTTTPIVVIPASGSAADVFTGSVHVIGALDIENITSPELIILPGDTLVGVGGVNIPTLVQGTSSPGDAPGTISSSQVTYANGSTLNIEIDGSTSSFSPACTDSTVCYATEVVTGGNTFTAQTGSTLATTFGSSGYSPPVGTSFIVVQAEGGVLGSFSSLTEPPSGLKAGTRLDALYYNTGSATAITNDSAFSPSGSTATQYAGNPNAIALYVTPADYTNLSDFSGTTLNQNQTQVGAGLNALRGAPGLRNDPQATWDFGYLFNLPPQDLPAIFDTLTGEVNADAAPGAFRLSDDFLELMLDPFSRPVAESVGAVAGGNSALSFADGNSQPGAPLNTLAAYNAVMPAPRPASFDGRWMAWGSGFGNYNRTDGDNVVAGTHNFTTSTYGFAAGMDYSAIPGARFGFALAGGGDNWAVTQENLGTGTNYNFQAGVYSRAHFGSLYLAGALSVANNWMQTNRTAFANDHLTASFDAQTYGARAEAGYGFVYKSVKFSPFGAGQILAFHTPDYNEADQSGGGFGLNYAAKTETDLSTQVGARLDALAFAGNMPIILRARAAWEHDWLYSAGLDATFLAGLEPGAVPGAGTSFIVNGAAQPSNLAVVTAGADLYLTRAISLSAKFDGQIASGSQTYGGSATLHGLW